MNKAWYALALFLFPAALMAGEVRNVSIETGVLYNKKDFSIPQYTTFGTGIREKEEVDKEIWNYEVLLRVDIDLVTTPLGTTYWNNTIDGKSTTRQFRYVAWDFEVGQRITGGVSVYYHHLSEHVLEQERDSFPLHDSFGIRLCFHGPACEP